MVGQTISHYKIIEKLGEGGMGVVYKAEDTRLNRMVALKFLSPHGVATEEDLERVSREARAAARLSNPHIATIFECDSIADPVHHESRTFIAMEYVEGETLHKILQRGTMPLDQVLSVATQLAEALASAHAHGIIHRDLKPDNIIMEPEGSVKILDFGLAKLIGESTLTHPGQVVGSAAYMSPEQIQGLPVDQRSDLFSLGVVLYEMATGRKPFLAEYEPALFYLIANADPDPPVKHRPDLSPDLADLIIRLLQKDPDNRCQSATEVRMALLKLAGVSPLPLLAATARNFVLTRKAVITIVFIAIFLAALLIPRVRSTVKDLLIGPGLPEEKSLAVIPFSIIGKDFSDVAYRDGLSEELTSNLTNLKQFGGALAVVPASEIRADNVTSVSDARRLYNVKLAVTGSIQLVMDQLHVILNLVDAHSMRQLRSEEIRNSKNDLEFLHDHIVTRLVKMLEIELTPEEIHEIASPGTNSSDAYKDYLDARGFLAFYDREGNIDRAIDLFTKSLAEDSLYARAHAGIGEAYLRKFNATSDTQWIDHAVRHCTMAVTIDKHLVPALITRGLLYRATGDYREALGIFHTALTIDRDNADAFRELAGVYEAMGDDSTAERTYKRAIELTPGFWAGYYNLGVFYASRGRYRESIGEFTTVISLRPYCAKAYSNLGGVYFYLEDWKQARNLLEKSIQIEPTLQGLNNLGTVAFYFKDYTTAAHAYEQALQMGQHGYEVWGNLASAYYWAGERDKARTSYQQAIDETERLVRINPQDPQLLKDLAGYYAMLKREKEARQYLLKALALNPKELQVVAHIGIIYWELGDHADALRIIRRALEGGYSLQEFTQFPGTKDLVADSQFQALASKFKGK
jgi:serine/threonine protein kinase/tetratricopeptide (TPR) repeat protein